MSSYSAVIGRAGSPPGGATDMKNYLARPLAIGTVALAMLAGRTTFAQSLSELSLEDLMRLDAGRVFGASERSQPVTEAPSSVSFITAEDITRYGYRSLAEILQGVRGLYVSDDRNFSWLGARGFVRRHRELGHVVPRARLLHRAANRRAGERQHAIA